jgi:hypothetical protein
LPKLAALLVALCAFSLQASGQAAQNQPPAASQLQPLPLPHLYWHFLIHQSELDALAAKLTAQGKDGQAVGNDLQTRLGFSDADYAPVRTSSQRLAAELQPIQAQLKLLYGSASNASQIQALIAQRETYIDNEVYNLSTELSAANKSALEAFMTAFFAPKNISASIPAASNGKAAQQ